MSSAIGFPPSDVVQYWSGQGWIKSTILISFSHHIHAQNTSNNIRPKDHRVFNYIKTEYFGALVGSDASQFTAALASYTARTRIEVSYMGSQAFETQAQTYLSSLNVTSGLVC